MMGRDVTTVEDWRAAWEVVRERNAAAEAAHAAAAAAALADKTEAGDSVSSGPDRRTD